MVDTIFKNLNILFQLADVHRLFMVRSPTALQASEFTSHAQIVPTESQNAA
jgi:hypothetical protein